MRTRENKGSECANGSGGLVKDGDEWQGPVFVFVVEPVSYDKLVGDGESGIVRGKRDFPTGCLVEQGAESDAFGTVLRQRLENEVGGMAAVHNILNDENIGAGQIEGWGREFPSRTGFRARCHHEVDLGGNPNRTGQVGGKGKGSLQNSKENEIFPFIVPGDPEAKLPDAVEDLFLSDQGFSKNFFHQEGSRD